VTSFDLLFLGLTSVPLLVAIVTLPVAIVLTHNGKLSRRVGAAVVGIAVPLVWPGLSILAFFMFRITPGDGGRYWLSILLPNVVLLLLVGGLALGIYLLATRRKQPIDG
jgi:hypothetical protein